MKNSGYNIGEDKYLIGHKYRSELAFLTAVNQGLLERISKTGKLWFFRLEQLTPAHCQQIEAVKEFIQEKKIEILKDAYYPLFHFCYNFKDVKFIWTKRDFNEVIKSILRLQKHLGMKPRSFNKQVNIFRTYDKINRDLMTLTGINYLEVHLESLLNNPALEADRLSEYLGKKIDVSKISRNETWKVQRVAQ